MREFVPTADDLLKSRESNAEMMPTARTSRSGPMAFLTSVTPVAWYVRRGLWDPDRGYLAPAHMPSERQGLV